MKSEIRSCLSCKKPFKVYACYAARKPTHGQYCSRRCRGDGMFKGENRTCPKCGKLFYARASQIRQGYGNYCSKPCWASTNDTGKDFNCIVCGKEFHKTQWQIKHGWTRYCSTRCFGIARRGLLHGNRSEMFKPWQRREWLGDSCAKCGATERLELDHIVPRFAGGGPDRDNAQTLCKPCNLRKYHNEDVPYYSWLKKYWVTTGRL